MNVSRETFSKNNFILVVFNIEETIYKCYNIQALFIVLMYRMFHVKHSIHKNIMTLLLTYRANTIKER